MKQFIWKKASIQMNLKIPCTSCTDCQIDSQAWCTCRWPVSSPCCSCCCWPRWRLMSSGYGHLACRWLALFCTGHGPLQFPAEVWRASRAFYTQAHNWPPLPTCTYWQRHKYAPHGEHIHIQEHKYAHKIICVHWHRPTINWTHT